MKIARVLFAAVAIVVTFAACDSPTGLDQADTQDRPVIGSGVGT
jgi:hypothetical protein